MKAKFVRNKKDEIVITISDYTDVDAVQRLLDYIEHMALTSGSKTTQAQIDKLARESGTQWWKKNRKRLLG